MSRCLSSVRRFGTYTLALSCGTGLFACRDLGNGQTLPSGTQDPSYYNTVTGALGMRNEAVIAFGRELPDYITVSGLLADELTNPTALGTSSGTVVANGGAVVDPIDERILPELPYGRSGGYRSDGTYGALNGMRAYLLQAIGQLSASDTSVKDTTLLKPAANRALRGELYALYGYTEILLADLFCSGIPLSTLDFQKDFTYKAGSTTSQVYQDAVAKFDTALALAGDSVRIVNLARVGLARAYLDLAYTNPAYVAAAADDVSTVPSNYQYQLQESLLNNIGSANIISPYGTVADREGVRGQAYLSSGDARTEDTTIVMHYDDFVTRLVGFPRVYAAGLTGAYVPITLASGTEARLIQAEAALARHDVPGWLGLLNQLRATAHIPGTPVLPDSLVDTLGVTQCGGTFGICGADRGYGGDSAIFGQPSGGFPATPDYTLAYADTTPGAHTIPAGDGGSINDYCYNYSWYSPCYDSDLMVVNVYRFAGGGSLLAPLSDPGSDSARVALTFDERAAWLYLTGHRQGDLRRQLRQYAKYWPDQSRVYPTGTYLGLGSGRYGTDVNAPIPGTEYINPLFHGCLSRAP